MVINSNSLKYHCVLHEGDKALDSSDGKKIFAFEDNEEKHIYYICQQENKIGKLTIKDKKKTTNKKQLKPAQSYSDIRQSKRLRMSRVFSAGATKKLSTDLRLLTMIDEKPSVKDLVMSSNKSVF